MILSLIQALLIPALGFASTTPDIVCRSEQTGMSYRLSPKKGFVEIEKDGKFVASADITFVSGQGEDIVYVMMAGSDQVGIINGEEGLRGSFDHGIFDRNLIDRGLVCSKQQQAGVASEIAKISKTQASCHDKAMSNAEMKQCEGASLDAADKILNREYKKLAASLTQNASDKQNMEIHRRLVTAQRAWIAFRDANCSLKATDMLGGTGEGLLVLGCLSETTKERVLELDTMFSNGR